MRILIKSRDFKYFFSCSKDTLQDVLRLSHDRSLNKYATIDEEDDFQEVLDPPSISPQTQFQLAQAFPDFSQHKVQVIL